MYCIAVQCSDVLQCIEVVYCIAVNCRELYGCAVPNHSLADYSAVKFNVFGQSRVGRVGKVKY